MQQEPEACSVLHWYAVQVRNSIIAPRVISDLEAQGFEIWWPTEEKQVRLRQHHWKPTSIHVPIFPGYLFLRADLTPLNGSDLSRYDRRLRILRTIGVVNIVNHGAEGPVEIPDGEINALRSVLAAGLKLVVDGAREWTKGQHVRVMRGPLRDQLGVIDYGKKKKTIFVVQIEALGFFSSVEVPADFLTLAA